MSEPRYTDADKRRFRLRYVKAADMHDGYLAERLRQYHTMVEADAKREGVVPIGKGKRK